MKNSELKDKEKTYRKRYPHFVKGTLTFIKEKNKIQCKITCTDCKAQRTIFTSDLFQVKRCENCLDSKRRAHRRNGSVTPKKPSKLRLAMRKSITDQKERKERAKKVLFNKGVTRGRTFSRTV